MWSTISVGNRIWILVLFNPSIRESWFYLNRLATVARSVYFAFGLKATKFNLLHPFQWCSKLRKCWQNCPFSPKRVETLGAGLAAHNDIASECCKPVTPCMSKDSPVRDCLYESNLFSFGRWTPKSCVLHSSVFISLPASHQNSGIEMHWCFVPTFLYMCCWFIWFYFMYINAFSLRFRDSGFGYIRPKWLSLIYISAERNAMSILDTSLRGIFRILNFRMASDEISYPFCFSGRRVHLTLFIFCGT